MVPVTITRALGTPTPSPARTCPLTIADPRSPAWISPGPRRDGHAARSSESRKTTLLTAIASVAPLADEIWLSGELASAPGPCLPPERRRIRMVSQEHALWPHLSARALACAPALYLFDERVSGAAPGRSTIGVGKARATVPRGTAPGADLTAPAVLVGPLGAPIRPGRASPAEPHRSRECLVSMKLP